MESSILINGVAPIQQFAYMPICLYFIIQIAYMQIQSNIVCVKYIVVFIQFTTVHTWYNVNYSIVCVLYIQLIIHVHVVTGIFSLGCTYLQIVLVQFDNNVSTNLKILCELYRQYIGNAVAYTDTLPISSIQEPIQIPILVQVQLYL